MTGFLSDKTFVGLDITGFENTGKYRPVSRVTLIVDDENVYTAGDDTGLELSASCPHATQEMANALLAQLKGYQYQSFTADAANLDPAAELGDGVTVGGVYSVLSKTDEDGRGFPEISAPGEVALEEEYPSTGPMTQEFNRKISQTHSLITKTAEEIRLEVKNEIDGLSASIDIKLDSITSTVQGLDNQISQIQQTIDSITLEVSNSTASSRISLEINGIAVSSQTIRFTGDVVFESDLEDGTTLISGDCIRTGEISANYIHLGGKMDVYRTASGSSFGGYIGYMSGMTASGSSTAGIAIASSNEAAVVICTTNGARMGYDGVSTVVCTATQVSISGNSVFINGEPQTTSDAARKTEVRYDVADYLSVFDRLKPCTFRYTDGSRRHLGLIAQEVQAVLAEEGIDEKDFAAVCTIPPGEDFPDGLNTLRYGEIQIMAIAKIHQLEKRIKDLEEKLNG